MSQPDGGPAFPCRILPRQTDSEFRSGLSPTSHLMPGMSLRDYFAAAALQGMMESWKMVSAEQVATWAYQRADAMLKAREQPVG